MLSIHHVSIMIRIFYIDWQQLWECDRTMNIGANANGEWMVSTKQPQARDLTSIDSWASSDIGSDRYWASFQVTRLFQKAAVSQCDHFVAATCVFVVWNFTRLITRLKSFFPRFGGGALSSKVCIICAVYWSLGRRGYFGVSNGALVLFCRNEPYFMQQCITLFFVSIDRQYESYHIVWRN